MIHAINMAIKTMHNKNKPVLRKKCDGIYVSQSHATIALWVGVQVTHDGLEDGYK